MIKHYCIAGQNDVAYLFYTLIQNYYEYHYINETFSNKLFVREDIYSFYLPYYMIIVTERLKKYNIGLKLYNILFTKKHVSAGEWWIKNLVYNFQFFVDKNKDISLIKKWTDYLALIREKKYNINEHLVTKYETINATLIRSKNLLKFQQDENNNNNNTHSEVVK